MKNLCTGCLQEFDAERKNQKYCSDACKQRTYRKRKRMFGSGRAKPMCAHCGREFYQRKRGRKAKYCGDSCKQLAYLKSKRESGIE